MKTINNKLHIYKRRDVNSWRLGSKCGSNMTSVAGKEASSGACATVTREQPCAFERFPQILHWKRGPDGAALILSAPALLLPPLLPLSLAEGWSSPGLERPVPPRWIHTGSHGELLISPGHRASTPAGWGSYLEA